MPNFARPLVVVEKVFKDSVVDLSWFFLIFSFKFFVFFKV